MITFLDRFEDSTSAYGAMKSENPQLISSALNHGLHLMTRNVKVFLHTGVLLINPWE